MELQDFLEGFENEVVVAFFWAKSCIEILCALVVVKEASEGTSGIDEQSIRHRVDVLRHGWCYR